MASIPRESFDSNPSIYDDHKIQIIVDLVHLIDKGIRSIEDENCVSPDKSDGRYSLVLDLMEEFRSIIVDTLVLSIFNLNILKKKILRS